MKNRPHVSHPKVLSLATDIDGFDALSELALDMHSSWNHATDQVWRQLDPVLWGLTRNPWVVLQTVSRERLQCVSADPAFRKIVDDLVRTRRDAMTAPTWFHQAHAKSAGNNLRIASPLKIRN